MNDRREMLFPLTLLRLPVPRWATAAPAAAMALLLLLLPTLVYTPLGESAAPQILDWYARPGLYLSDLAVIALIVTVSWRRRALAQLDSYALAPLALLILLALVSIPRALAPDLAGYTAARWTLAFLLFLAVRLDRTPLPWIAGTLLAVLAGQALIGMAQVWVQGPLGLPGELTLPPGQPGAAVIGLGETRWLRAYGLTFHPNVLGGFLAAGALIGLPLVRHTGLRLLWWLVWAGLLLSFSRSAWLAVAVTLPPAGLWLLRYRPELRRPLLLTAVGAAVISFIWLVAFGGQVRARVDTTGGSGSAETARSLPERAELQAVALGAIADRPLTGIGAGNSPLAVLETGAHAAPQPIHNVPLLLAAEVGVVGGALWLWLLAVPGTRLARRWLSSPRHAGSNWTWPVVLLAAWLALAVIGLWDGYPWALESGRLLSVVVLGLLLRAGQEMPA